MHLLATTRTRWPRLQALLLCAHHSPCRPWRQKGRIVVVTGLSSVALGHARLGSSVPGLGTLTAAPAGCCWHARGAKPNRLRGAAALLLPQVLLVRRRAQQVLGEGGRVWGGGGGLVAVSVGWSAQRRTVAARLTSGSDTTRREARQGSRKGHDAEKARHTSARAGGGSRLGGRRQLSRASLLLPCSHRRSPLARTCQALVLAHVPCAVTRQVPPCFPALPLTTVPAAYT